MCDNKETQMISHKFTTVTFECGNCHKLIQENDNFCPRCGARFTEKLEVFTLKEILK